jgi:hypothetical protein
MNVQIKLSAVEVQQIVQEHLESKFKVIGKAKLEVGTEWRGQYTGEYQATVFKGATCEVEV